MRPNRLVVPWLTVLLLATSEIVFAQAPLVQAVSSNAGTAVRPLLELGPGDQVKLEVFRHPEMDTTVDVSDDGTISVPLAGLVNISNLSPAAAGRKVELALEQGRFLVNPHVTLTVVRSLSQRVSVLGEVHSPGRYPIESNSTILDVLAQAGGRTDKAADVVYLLRTDSTDRVERYPIDLNGLDDGQDGSSRTLLMALRGGDRIVIPEAHQFFVSGEVHSPAGYRFQQGMTVLQAISAAGGITELGSMRRIEIKRRDRSGSYRTYSASPSDKIEPDDVINVKQRIF